MGIRRHYITICFKDNIEVTAKETNGIIITTYERAKGQVFQTAELDLNGNILRNDGFTPADIEFIRDFQIRNADGIVAVLRGDFDA